MLSDTTSTISNTATKELDDFLTELKKISKFTNYEKVLQNYPPLGDS
jgi:hypothetical protein